MNTAPIIPMSPCESSQLSGYGYDASSQTLAISFPGRGAQPDTIYHYFDVPAEVYAALQASESKGKFFGAEIRTKYRYEKQPDANGIAFGLPLAQEPKYTTGSRDGRVINRATGKPIPDDEPIFILRAKDVHATAALAAYLSAITATTEPEHVSAVQRRIDAFDAFAAAHPDLVKQPDTAAA
jgi:hypothetical protein